MDQEQLTEAYAAIAELEPELYETTSFRPRHSMHYLPLALAMIFYTLYHAGARWLSGRAPREPVHVQ
jgi:Ca-activated chloride channel family protein